MPKPKPDAAPIVRAAMDLDAAVAELEQLTRRLTNQALRTDDDLVRAAELLASSEQAHRRFLDHLAALAAAVEDLRQRQNASARTCGERATLLDARRKLHDALSGRFGALGEAAREVLDLVGEASGGADGRVLEQAEEKLSVLVEQAGALFADAREAELTDLERQAHAMAQQLAALHRKVAARRGG
jgi:hypothetical protein